MAGAPQGYIGRNPSDGRTTINRQTFNVTTGVQTSFTFTSGYDLGYLDVYLNGVKQNETTDYTAADGSTFSFASSTPAVQGDTIEAIAYKSFNTTNVTGSTRDFAVGRNLDVSGNVTIGSSLTIASDLVVNGTYTYVNTEILDIEDKTIGIASTSAASNTTADGGGIVVYGGSDGDKSLTWNRQKSNWVLVGGGVSIGTGCTIGSSTANVLEFSVDGAVNAKLNNYGAFIVGDGVSGEAWGNAYKTVQAGSGAFGGNAPAANAASYWTNNAYFDDVNSRWEYIAADEASRFEQGNGALAYYNAGAGSADGAITWTERLRIDSSGRLLLGTTTEGHTSADDLTIATSGHTGMTIRSGTSSSGNIYFSSATSGGDEYNGYIIYDHTNDSLRFGTNENDRVTFNSGGNALFTGIVTATSFSGPTSGTTGTFTGDVSIADKIVHIGDTDTAIRFPSADIFTTEIGGSEKFRVNSDGTITQGTIQVDGAEGGSAQIRMRADEGDDNSDTFRFLVEDGGNGLKIQGYDGSYQTRLQFTSTGKLEVKGGNLDFEQQNNSINTANGSILFSNSSTETTSRIAGFTGGSNDDGDLRFYTKNGGTETEALRISQHATPKLQLLGGESEIVPNASDGSLTFRADPGQNRGLSNISLEVDNAERIYISTNKVFVHGTGATQANDTSTLIANGNTLNIHGTSSVDGITVVRYSADYGAYGINIGKSNNSTFGTNTLVTQGEELGHVSFYGADGTNFEMAAQITGLVDINGAPTNGTDMPGALSFRTSPDGTATPGERLKIDCRGFVGINESNPDELLHLSANNTSASANAFQSAGNTIRLTDTDTSVTTNQPGGTIEWETLDSTAAGVNAYIATKNSNTGYSSMHFGTGNASTLATRFSIDQAGNVGINDTAPSYVLNVAGDNASSNGAGMVKGIIGVQNDTTAFGSSPTAGISFQTKYRTSPDVPLDVAAVYGGKENTSDADKDGYFGIAVREEGGTASELERVRVNSNGQLITKNVLDSSYMFQVNESLGFWHTNTGLAPNSTRTWTISGMNYGHGTFRLGGLDGNYQRGGCVIEVVGGMWATHQVYYYNEVIKSSSGASVSIAYNTDNIVVTLASASNWFYYSATWEQGRRNGSVYATITTG